MDIKYIFISVHLMIVDGFSVKGPSGPLVVPLGSSVVLPCYVDEPLLLEGLKVEWRRTDSETLVHLFLDGESRPEEQHKDYHNRAHFFTDQIQHGNFSLHLDNIRAEDKAVYRCKVYSQQVADKILVEIKDVENLKVSGSDESVSVGFSSWHTTVLVFCFVSGSGAVLLLCRLIYCRSKNTVSRSTIWNLQLSLVFFPNICMSIAFIFWGLTEGFLNETITCCALYILRPIMLIWALPYLKYLQDNIKTWIRSFKITSEFAVFTVIVYSVIFTYGWRKSAHDTNNDRRVGSGLYFGDVVLSCLLLSTVEFIRLSCQERSRGASSRIQTLVLFNGIFLLSLSQLSQLTFSFGLPSLAFVMMPFVQALLLLCVPVLPLLQSKLKCLRRRWITLLWIITITLLDIILVIYIHLAILEREKEYMGWICVIVFLEALRMIAVYEFSVTEAERSRDQRRRQQTETSQQGSNALHLCHEIMYMFGAVGLVLLNSVTLTAELILKARNGERVLKDLRVIVFLSECVFAFYCLVLQMHAFWKIDTTESTHNQRNTHQRHRCQLRKSETHEMENLSAPDSAVSQTP